MAATPLTIAMVKSFPVGTPVPMIQGVITEVYEYKTNVGKHQATIQSAILRDNAGDKIRLNIWNHKDYAPDKGRAITIIAVTEKGKCSTRSMANDYYTPPAIELEVTKTSQILFSGSSDATPPPDHSEQGNSGSEAPPTSTKSAPVARRIDGKNVGMCVKEAVGIVMRVEGADTLDFVLSPDFSRDVWTIASDLIRVSGELEEGKLALSAKQRWLKAHPEDALKSPPSAESPPITPPATPAQPPVKPATPPVTAPTKPRPGPDGSAFDPNGPVEDVPF
jgi:hypothetical protein